MYFGIGSASERETLRGRETFVYLNEGNYLLDAVINRQRSNASASY